METRVVCGGGEETGQLQAPSAQSKVEQFRTSALSRELINLTLDTKQRREKNPVSKVGCGVGDQYLLQLVHFFLPQLASPPVLQHAGRWYQCPQNLSSPSSSWFQRHHNQLYSVVARIKSMRI